MPKVLGRMPWCSAHNKGFIPFCILITDRSIVTNKGANMKYGNTGTFSIHWPI